MPDTAKRVPNWVEPRYIRPMSMICSWFFLWDDANRVYESLLNRQFYVAIKTIVGGTFGKQLYNRKRWRNGWVRYKRKGIVMKILKDFLQKGLIGQDGINGCGSVTI